MGKRLRRIAGPLVTGAFVIGLAASQKPGAAPLADLPAGGQGETAAHVPNVVAPDAARFAANFEIQLRTILPTLTLMSETSMNGKYAKFNRALFRSIGTVNIGSRVRNPLLTRDQKVAGHAMLEAFADPEVLPTVTESLRQGGPDGRRTAAQLEKILEKLHSNKSAYKLLREIAISLRKRHGSSIDEYMRSSLDAILSGKLISNQITASAATMPRDPGSGPHASGLKPAPANDLVFLPSPETENTFAPELLNRFDPALPSIWFQMGPVKGFLGLDPERGLMGFVADPRGKQTRIGPLAALSLDKFYRSLSRQIQAGLGGQELEKFQKLRRQALREMSHRALWYFSRENLHPEISVEDLTDAHSRFVVRFDRHVDWKYFEGRSKYLSWLTQKDGRFYFKSLEVVFEDGEAVPRSSRRFR